MTTTKSDQTTHHPELDRLPSLSQADIDFYMRRGERIRSQEVARIFGALFSWTGRLPARARAYVTDARATYRKPSHG